MVPPSIEFIPITRELARDIGVDPGGRGLVSLNDEASATVQDVARAQLAMYDRTGAAEPWIGYFGSRVDTGEIVGSCSFVGPPKDGFVEIAYFTFPRFEGQGFARAMAAELVSIARSHAPSPNVYAHTLPELNASTSVLARLGFRRAGEATDDEAGPVWRWEADFVG
jgi:[ribosomal protein S5]-alanine N-acetyltransferase